MADSAGLLRRWDAWVQEIEDHPLDENEYLGAMQCRDELARALEIDGDERVMEAADRIDARYERVTVEDGRLAQRFSTEAGAGWWWSRLPADAEAQRYMAEDWD